MFRRRTGAQVELDIATGQSTAAGIVLRAVAFTSSRSSASRAKELRTGSVTDRDSREMDRIFPRSELTARVKRRAINKHRLPTRRTARAMSYLIPAGGIRRRQFPFETTHVSSTQAVTRARYE